MIFYDKYPPRIHDICEKRAGEKRKRRIVCPKKPTLAMSLSRSGSIVNRSKSTDRMTYNPFDDKQ